jgi:Flp pilus assembly protein TadB
VALHGSYRGQRSRYTEAAFKYRSLSGEGEPEGGTSAWLNWAIERMPAERDPHAAGRTARMLSRAGFYRARAAVIFRLIRLVATGAGLAIGVEAGHLLKHTGTEALLAGICGGAIGVVAPPYLINRRGRKRQRRIGRQLSNLLDLLVVCVEAGLGLFDAVKIVGQETDRQGQEIGLS